MTRRFEVAARAREDLADIRRHVAESAGPRTASAVISRLRKRLSFVRETPMAGAPVPELGANLRMVVSQRWLIYYLVTADACRVIRVLDGARDQEAALTTLHQPT